MSNLAPLTITFERDRIAAYAEASGDRNPIHLDDEFARSVGLEGVIAHGMLQMAMLARLALGAAGAEPSRLRALSCRFAAMVRPGDAVTFGGEDLGEGRLRLWARNQSGEAVLTKASAELDLD